MASAVVARDLVKRFGSGTSSVTAVDGLSLEVRKGEILAFLGPNGAGKTTSIRMMTGLLAPTSGETTILGERVEPAGGRARELVGLCPQETVLWPNLTAAENLAFLGRMHGLPRGRADERSRDLLAKLGLTEKASARADALSGGMKRRLNVAMALVHDPEVVVFDEPEAGLDPQARLVVREFIQQLRREKTVILTTHNMDEAERVADRVAIVDHGKLIALDTPDGLRASIGKGDVLEVRLPADRGPEVAKRLEGRDYEVSLLEDRLVVRGLSLAGRLPEILKAAEAAGASPEDVRYRGNTLEDVFISLTGRGLRE